MQRLHRGARGGADDADACPQAAQIRQRRVQAVDEKTHAVYASENEPVVVRESSDSGIQRRRIGGGVKLDNRKLDHRRAERAQTAREFAGLLVRARYDDTLAEEWQ